MKNKIIVAASLLLLTACSRTPSTSDAQAALQDKFSSCNRLALENVAKTNGMPDGDNGYQVAVKYTLHILPPDGVDAKKAEFSAMYAKYDGNAQLNQEKAEADALRKQYNDASTKAFGNTDPATIAMLEQMQAKSMAADRDLTAKMTIPYDYNGRAQTEFIRACPALGNDTRNGITEGATIYRGANPGKDPFLEGFTVDFTDTVYLVQTDNGWKARL